MLLGASERPFCFALLGKMQDAEFEREAAGFSSRAIPLRRRSRQPKSPLGRKPKQVPRCRSVVYCRGSVRRPVRPFVIEFKPRSSKFSAPRSPRIDEAGKINATPAFLDVGVFTANRSGQGDDYKSAMKAADAVFGRSDAGAAEPISPPNAPTGRVLPSLIENVDALADPSTEIEKKPRRGRVAKKAETAPLLRVKPRMRPKTPTIRPESVAPQDFVKPAAIVLPPNTPTAAEPDREPRSLRKRRLLDAELKAGERWKRRLCKAAR